MNIATLGIDIGKTWFHVVGTNVNGKPLFQKKLHRPKLMQFIGTCQPCLIGMEACAGSQHLARRFGDFGHDVKLMAPRFVKPYLKSNKNDFNDAAAIAEAVQRPTMRFVTVRSVEQCPCSNKWDRCLVLLRECFAHHFHVTRRVVDSANDVSR